MFDDELDKPVRRLAQCSRKLSEAEECIADTVSDFIELLDQHRAAAPVCSHGNHGASKRKSDPMKKLLRYPLADPQAQALEIFSHPDGSADVRIDGGRSIKLTPVLAALLSCLAEDTGWSNDDLVGWKTYEQIASFLQAKTGKTYRRRTVVHHIYRLRDELLRQGGFLHYLIQNNRQYGWRLALKRKAEVASPLWVKSQLSCAD